MPSLTYDPVQQRVEPAQAGANAQGARLTHAVGQSLEQLGNVGNQLAADHARIENAQRIADGVSQIRTNSIKADEDFTTYMQDMQSKVPVNGAGYVDAFKTKFDGWWEQQKDLVKDSPPQVQRIASEYAVTLHNKFYSHATQWQVSANQAWREDSANQDLTHQAADLQQSGGDQYEERRANLRSSVLSLDLQPAARLRMINRIDNELPQAASYGFVNKNPQVAFNLLMGEHPLAPTTVQAKIIAGAKAAGVDPAQALAIADAESGTSATAQNPASSAHGLFQMIGSTWNQYAPPGTDPNNPDAQIAAGMKFTADNQKALTQTLGRAPSPGELYMAHVFGIGGATKVLKAPDNAPIRDIVGQYDPQNASAIVGNNGMDGMTVAQAKRHWDSVIGSHMAKTAGYISAPASDAVPSTDAMPAFFRDLSPPQRQAMLSHAQSLLHKDDAEQRMTLQARIKDTMGAYSVGANPPNPPTFADYAALYPAPVAASMFAEQRGWQQFGSDVGAMNAMPAAQKSALLAARAPMPGEGFVGAAERYNELLKASNHIDQLRDHDQIKFAIGQGGGLAKQVDMSNPDTMTGPLNARFIQADQIAKDYALPYKPFQESEVVQMGQFLDKAPAVQARQYLASIAASADTPEHYKAGMEQLAPHNSSAAVAGIMAQYWKSGQPDGASFILTGMRMRNPSKGEKDAEGKKSTVIMPPVGGPAGLRARWEQDVGAAYGANHDSSNSDFNAVLDYYAGRVAPGSQSEVLDEKVWNEAVNFVAPHATHAGQTVLVPPGVDPTTFNDRVSAMWPDLMTAHGLDPAQYPANAFPLVSLSDGSYAVASGSQTLYGADGQPVRFTMDGSNTPTNVASSLPPARMPAKGRDPFLTPMNRHFR